MKIKFKNYNGQKMEGVLLSAGNKSSLVQFYNSAGDPITSWFPTKNIEAIADQM